MAALSACVLSAQGSVDVTSGTLSALKFRGIGPAMCSGRIIDIASVVGVTGNAGQANYAASKAGVIGLTRSAAKELAGRGVAVNAIAPGFIETDMTENLPEQVKEKGLAGIPMRRFGVPEDIAGVITFLATDEASYLTAQVIAVDGGMT